MSSRTHAPSSTGRPPFPARMRLVGQELRAALPSLGPAPRVLDCGGGTGSMAVPLAAAGASVTVLDISADALATARRRALEAALDRQVATEQVDLDQLVELDAADRPQSLREPFDLVLVHDVLGSLDAPTSVVRLAAALVRPGGLLSIVAPNPIAAVVARAVAGDPSAALAELRRVLEPDPAELDSARVTLLVESCGLRVRDSVGLGALAEFLPVGSDSTGSEPAGSDPDVRAELERLAARQPALRAIAPRLHVLAERNG